MRPPNPDPMDKTDQKRVFVEDPDRMKRDGNGDLILRDTSLLPLKIYTRPTGEPDPRIVSWKYYNRFNFSRLTGRHTILHRSLGVTSAVRQEGKTHVAANMAVSLAQAYQRRTVLVDLNFANPQLHNVFATRLEPGVAEAMEFRTLRINPTRVKDLFLMTAGDAERHPPGIHHTIALREVLYTLKNEFDFIIIDMCSVFPIQEFPVHFMNEIDGLIHVVNLKQTKKGEVNRIYHHLDEDRFVGYVFNRVEEGGKR